MQAPIAENEAARLAALLDYSLLDSKPEEAFDDIAVLASYICQTPMALVVLVDGTRQWFKSKIGIDVDETPREHAFCAHAILGAETLIVEDARKDRRFLDNPFVTKDPGVRFYAGAPLIDAQGYALGTLCVIDHQPRGLSHGQRDALEALARQVVALMELRRVSASLAAALEDKRALEGLLPICAWCKNIRDDQGYWERVDDYLTRHSRKQLTHSICPSCMEGAAMRDDETLSR